MRVTPRAGIVVTGTEVLTGRVRDRNGPWLAERLMILASMLLIRRLWGTVPRTWRGRCDSWRGRGSI